MSPQPSSSTVSRHVGMVSPKKRFLFDAHKLAAERFQDKNDGRKARHQAAKRRALLIELASFGNAVGLGACPSNKTLAKRLGWSEPTVERFMKDLKTLGFVQNKGKSRFGGTIVRELSLNPRPMPSDSSNAIPSDSEPMPSDSIAMPSPNDGPMPSRNDGRSAFELPINISAHTVSATASEKPKPVASLSSPSAQVKTNPKGAGKEIQKPTRAVRNVTECENCQGPTDGESICFVCSDFVLGPGA